jgi:pimeloyl-ACP methyl ester carboxylesterase
MVDCPDIMRDRLLRTIDHAYQDTGQAVTLIGHSFGGMIARGAAQKRRDKVKRVIMLASPFRRPRAHPLVMKLIGLVHGRQLNRHIHRTENSCIKCFLDTMSKPIGPVNDTAIYTRTDPVVNWYDCKSYNEDHNYEVSGTHIGLAANHQVYQIIAEVLAR